MIEYRGYNIQCVSYGWICNINDYVYTFPTDTECIQFINSLESEV